MDFVVMGVTLQVRNGLLPVGGQDVFVLPSEALVNLSQ